MNEQTEFPEVTEITVKKMKEDFKDDMLNDFRPEGNIHSVRNALASVRMVMGAIGGIQHLNEESKGLGEVKLNRSRFKDIEKANVRSLAIIEVEDKEKHQVSKSTTKREILNDKFPPIDWSKIKDVKS